MTKEAAVIGLSEIGARVRDAQQERAAEGEVRKRRKLEILDELEEADPVDDTPPVTDWSGIGI